MSQQQIINIEGAAALPLSAEVLSALGIKVGDNVDLSLVGRQLLVQSAQEAKAREQLNAIVDDVFERRRTAYEQLAKGPA